MINLAPPEISNFHLYSLERWALEVLINLKDLHFLHHLCLIELECSGVPDRWNFRLFRNDIIQWFFLINNKKNQIGNLASWHSQSHVSTLISLITERSISTVWSPIFLFSQRVVLCVAERQHRNWHLKYIWSYKNWEPESCSASTLICLFLDDNGFQKSNRLDAILYQFCSSPHHSKPKSFIFIIYSTRTSNTYCSTRHRLITVKSHLIISRLTKVRRLNLHWLITITSEVEIRMVVAWLN